MDHGLGWDKNPFLKINEIILIVLLSLLLCLLVKLLGFTISACVGGEIVSWLAVFLSDGFVKLLRHLSVPLCPCFSHFELDTFERCVKLSNWVKGWTLEIIFSETAVGKWIKTGKSCDSTSNPAYKCFQPGQFRFGARAGVCYCVWLLTNIG